MSDDSRTRPGDIGPGAAQRNPEGGLSDLIHHDRALARPVAGTLRFDVPGDGSDGDETNESVLEIVQGIDVLCANGEKIGEVVEIIGDQLVVERGFFIPSDVYIPKEVISGLDETGLRLTLTKKQFEARDWSEEPEVDGEPAEHGSA